MKMIWIVLLIVTPTLGVLMYLYIKFQVGSFVLKKRLKKIDNRSERYLNQDEKIINDLTYINKNVASLAKYVDKYNGCPIYRNTTVDYFPCGKKCISQ